MKYFGAHVSASGGVQNAPLNAKKIGAKALALFTKNQRQWNAKPLREEDIRDFKSNLEAVGISSDHVLPHDSYLINLGTPDETVRAKSYSAFVDELERCRLLGLSLLNLHPGAHTNKCSEEESLALIADGINRAFSEVDSVIAVLENTAGQGSNLGYRFEQLRAIIDQVQDNKRVGVCIDTCHAFAAGYDLRDRASYDAMWNEFDRVIGRRYLRGMHLNDSKKGIGSRVDRHDCLGDGELGWETFRLVAADPRLDDLPLILETPNEDGWQDEIAALYTLTHS